MSIDQDEPSASPIDRSTAALAEYRTRMRRKTWIYVAALATVTVLIVVLVQVVLRTGEIGNATLHPATSTVPAPGSTTTSATLTQAWHSDDATATGIPYDAGTVITYNQHTVTGRNYATGAAVWTYTRTDVSTCVVFQEFGVTVAIFTDRDGYCDEADAFNTSTGARDWYRTLDSNGNTVVGKVAMTASQYTLMITAPKYIQALDPVSAIDRWTFIDPPGCTNTSAVQGSVGVLISQHCGNGDHLILRDAYASDDDNNKAKANWNILSNAIPVSADGLVAAFNPTTGQLMVYSSSDGTVEQTQDLTPAPVLSGGAASISNQAIGAGQLVTVAGVTYALAASTGVQLWSLTGASRPHRAVRQPVRDHRAGHQPARRHHRCGDQYRGDPGPACGFDRVQARHGVRHIGPEHDGLSLSADDDPTTLTGSWTIERTLLDRASDQHGSFSGTALVRPDADGLFWVEAGTLSWLGRDLVAYRQLALRQLDGRWWMTFADGRPFHRWVLGEQVIHPCAADTYRGVIERPTADELVITWQVDGPAKDQLIVSKLRRQPPEVLADNLVQR